MYKWSVQNLSVAACGLISLGVLDFFFHRITNYLIRKATQLTGDEIIFFSDKGDSCRPHIFNQVPCGSADCAYASIRKILQYIELANETIDVCVYHLTLQNIAYSLLKMHANGVKIRVIADADMMENSGSQIPMLKKQGIPVFAKKTPNFMHHKFLIVDHKILINCCLNWTLQAVAGNWESVVITSERDLVRPFDVHFEEVMEVFEKCSD